MFQNITSFYSFLVFDSEKYNWEMLLNLLSYVL